MTAVERMRSDLRYADSYRNRAGALDGLGMLLECETPGTVSEVSVKGGRWFRRTLGGIFKSHNPDDDGKREIILSTDERREFADWCKERAAKLRQKADEIEARLTTTEAS
ncbi:hypothetical protein [Pseudarthrobacter cellobiosi]|uniref:hypothetical protein n=1 Tax=Pseudarthrobacter cellobiosi TaxID=2953654 RepID=UPI00208E876D|nr:hypothetical protein [Pseudarthrobacter sp. HLT1-5]MCO4257383.1 hypothetical protein [Pseudarthrobacter sp. HLT1-5]